MRLSRRSFLKRISIAASGAAAGAHVLRNNAHGLQIVEPPPVSQVKFATGTDRRQLMADVLGPLEETITQGIAGKQVILKPNCVWNDTALCATHVDALRGALDVLQTLTDQQIIIAESPASGDAMNCFDVYGYTELENEYNVRLVDLNVEQTVVQDNIMQDSGEAGTIDLIGTFLDENNYFISICRPKTHDTVIATLTVKNLIMGSPHHPGGAFSNSHKPLVHGGNTGSDTGRLLSENMLLLENQFMPHLAIIDGAEGMEGNGPVGGDPVDHGIALAGTDAIAVDKIAATLMGIDTDNLIYLRWAAAAGLGNWDDSRIEVDGPSLEDHIIQYQMHEDFETELEWIQDIPAHIDRHTPVPFMQVRNASAFFGRPAEISFSLPVAMDTELHIYDFLGRPIRRIADSFLDPGRYTVAWEGRDDYGVRVPAGTYLVRLRTGSSSAVGQISLYR
jgi:uncharacterized protein (DUF362 family)